MSEETKVIISSVVAFLAFIFMLLVFDGMSGWRITQLKSDCIKSSRPVAECIAIVK